MSEAQLSEQDFLDSLPDDFESAFPLYETWVKQECTNYSELNPDGYIDFNRYFLEILEYCKYYHIDIGYTEKNISYNDNDSFSCNQYDFLNGKISAFRRKMSIRASSKRKSNINPSYKLTPALREKIHHHLNEIREKIPKLDLNEEKKNNLLKQLDAFATSINKEKVSLNILGSLTVSIEKYAPPCADFIKSITSMLTKSEPWQTHLIEKEKRKLLSSPQKKIEDKSQSSDNIDDDIPF